MLRKIRKDRARKLFNEGRAIKIIPCRANPASIWMGFIEIQKDLPFAKEHEGNTFDKIVNAFEYYNCNPEMGRYAHFYIEEV